MTLWDEILNDPRVRAPLEAEEPREEPEPGYVAPNVEKILPVAPPKPDVMVPEWPPKPDATGMAADTYHGIERTKVIRDRFVEELFRDFRESLKRDMERHRQRHILASLRWATDSPTLRDPEAVAQAIRELWEKSQVPAD